MLCVWMQIKGMLEERGLHTLRWIVVTRTHHTSVVYLHFCKGPAAGTRDRERLERQQSHCWSSVLLCTDAGAEIMWLCHGLGEAGAALWVWSSHSDWHHVGQTFHFTCSSLC